MSLSLLLNRSGAGLGVLWLGWRPQDLGFDRALPAQEETGLSSHGAQEAGRGTPGEQASPSGCFWHLPHPLHPTAIDLLQPLLSCLDYCKGLPTAMFCHQQPPCPNCPP